MKRNVLVVVSSNNYLVRTVTQAATQTGRGVTTADSTQQLFKMLSLGLANVDIVILEICASLHSLAILEALSYSQAAPPIIALVEVDEAEATAIVRRHGAAACLRKPFGAAELAMLIDNVCASAGQNKSLSCDKWGHVCTPNVRKSQPELMRHSVASSRQQDKQPFKESFCAETTAVFTRFNEAGLPPRRGRRETPPFLPSHDPSVPGNGDNGGEAILQRAAAKSQ